MIGIFKGRRPGEDTAVIVHDLYTYQHGYSESLRYDFLEDWIKTVKVVANKELCQW